MMDNAKKEKAAIEILNLTKSFGHTEVLNDINLEIRKGEMVTLLGPSGCGKTTTLNCITGIVPPDSGRIIIDGVDVTQKPTYQRDCGQVFQSFALFPHLTVFNNVAFPLAIRKLPKADIRERVMEVLKTVHLDDQADKFPNQLSGGQQQRVGLCRALVYRPKVLLFDEPLSNLDAKLREAMRFEIREIQHKYGITSLFVTHDQQEALAISDLIAIMENGRIVQYDTPYRVYKEPRTEFVAGFIGLTNLLRGEVEGYAGKYATVNIGGGIQLQTMSVAEIKPRGKIICSIRPKDIELFLPKKKTDTERANTFKVQIERKTYLGETIDYRVGLQNFGPLRIVTDRNISFDKDYSVYIHIPPEHCWLIKE